MLLITTLLQMQQINKQAMILLQGTGRKWFSIVMYILKAFYCELFWTSNVSIYF